MKVMLRNVLSVVELKKGTIQLSLRGGDGVFWNKESIGETLIRQWVGIYAIFLLGGARSVNLLPFSMEETNVFNHE